MAKQEIRACLLLHPSSIQFGAGQSGDVSGHNPSDGQDKTWGQGEVLSWRIQLRAIAACLQLSAIIGISPAMGYPCWELSTAAEILPKGCREGVKLSQSWAASPTLCLPACPYPDPPTLIRAGWKDSP